MIDLVYLVAAAAFILGLKRLSSPRTARSGNLLASVGMLIAVVATVVDQEIVEWWAVLGGLLVGSVLGALVARWVAMTSMPELVAALNGSGGASSALVAASTLVAGGGVDLPTETSVTTYLSLTIGSLTLTGSFVAFGKLQGVLPGRPIRSLVVQAVSIVCVAALVASAVWAVASDEQGAYWLAAAAALVLGVLFVLPIGGADMPVVISMLNSFSGLAAAATGFVIDNSALIVAGALVGSAGLILTLLMCEAMNRPLVNVLFGGFGTGDGDGSTGDIGGQPVNRATADDVAIALGYANSVIVVPGYGLAVAQAQHALRQLATALESRGVTVHYAIHPVAGRMPGHMNVLLAEAEVPYDQLLELEEANARLPSTDAVLVVGANDVVNPSAREDPASVIYGMPILDVDRASTVIVVKRSLSPGFAGIDNPLFYLDNALMYFADAREALERSKSALESI